MTSKGLHVVRRRAVKPWETDIMRRCLDKTLRLFPWALRNQPRRYNPALWLRAFALAFLVPPLAEFLDRLCSYQAALGAYPDHHF